MAINLAQFPEDRKKKNCDYEQQELHAHFGIPGVAECAGLYYRFPGVRLGLRSGANRRRILALWPDKSARVLDVAAGAGR